jgi:hypothetical protein
VPFVPGEVACSSPRDDCGPLSADTAIDARRPLPGGNFREWDACAVFAGRLPQSAAGLTSNG